MATVYLAEDVKHHRQVALKVLKPELSAILGSDRFLREIELSARLTHPHILPLHDSGSADGLLYYVMPYVEGESLRDRLNREKQLPVDDALQIARELADGLSYAHAHGVIHRDIKPENILLESGHAVVADFGIARAIGAARGDHLTQTGTSVGTPAYMSPEQAAGSKDLDGRSDLYALGCVLYEMLAGQPPFTGPTVESVVHQHLAVEPPNVTSIRPAVSASVAAAIQRALAKTPADRFSGTHQFAKALEARAAVQPAAVVESARTPSAAEAAPSAALARPKRRRPRLALVLALAALLVIAALFVTRAARVIWARSRGIPTLQSYVAAGDWEEAYGLAARLDAIISNDTTVAAMRRVFADTMTIEGTPVGARVYRKAYAAGASTWEFIGAAPIRRIILPRFPAVSQFRFEADGFATGFDIGGAASNTSGATSELRFALAPAVEVPPGMVRVLGGVVAPDIAKLNSNDSATIADFYLDKFEVTNQQYQEFVDSGGYRRREFWEHEFAVDGRRLAWNDGIARLVDQTGRPGPATWETGRYPRGQADHPVGGLSWYEAAAYAKFRGERLPTVFEWWRAAKLGAAGAITSASNIQDVHEGTVPVGSLGSLSGFGAMDMAGNVREWCINKAESSDGRFTLGGGWNDGAYVFYEPAIQAPFDRTATNGMRLVLPISGAEANRSAFRPIGLLARDYRVERPVTDRVFQIYRGLFAYDPSPLHARVERHDSSQQWIVERVSYDAAYGGERMTAYLYLPVNARPPYQTAVYFPGGSAIQARSSEGLNTGYFDFLVQAGRAVIHPIYKGTFERGDGTRFSDPDVTNSYKEHVIMWEKDVSRTLDYLATRGDIDTAKIAYLGASWGGRFGGVVLAIEPRFKAAVLSVAGLNFRHAKPEVDDINYLPRVHTPVLMINGRHDFTFPLETAAQPMFDFLGTPPDRKRHAVVDGVHYVPRHDLIRETLAWLDRFLGPVR